MWVSGLKACEQINAFKVRVCMRTLRDLEKDRHDDHLDDNGADGAYGAYVFRHYSEDRKHHLGLVWGFDVITKIGGDTAGV